MTKTRLVELITNGVCKGNKKCAVQEYLLPFSVLHEIFERIARETAKEYKEEK